MAKKWRWGSVALSTQFAIGHITYIVTYLQLATCSDIFEIGCITQWLIYNRLHHMVSDMHWTHHIVAYLKLTASFSDVFAIFRTYHIILWHICNWPRQLAAWLHHTIMHCNGTHHSTKYLQVSYPTDCDIFVIGRITSMYFAIALTCKIPITIKIPSIILLIVIRVDEYYTN